jgi:nucleoside phosphorylase
MCAAAKGQAQKNPNHTSVSAEDDARAPMPITSLRHESPTRLTRQDYKVGWICALKSELTAAMAMLDERHSPLEQDPADHNTYTLGRVGQHNVVIACLPAGQTGNNSAATVAAQMRFSFREIRYCLMVGIGGGTPSADHDIRLGDVVVSIPGRQNGGVVQYDFGKTMVEGRFVHTGHLSSPPTNLLTALNVLQAEHELNGSRFASYLEAMNNPKLRLKFAYPGAEHDQLFQAEYDHVGGSASCEQCDVSKRIARPVRDDPGPVIHYGTIASGNQVMKHGGTRDRLGRELGVLCFEMEAAGLMNEFPCVVIRGICDYADSHKNKLWQEHAAAIAAAYAKELLGSMPTDQSASTPNVAAVTAKGKSTSSS